MCYNLYCGFRLTYKLFINKQNNTMFGKNFEVNRAQPLKSKDQGPVPGPHWNRSLKSLLENMKLRKLSTKRLKEWVLILSK